MSVPYEYEYNKAESCLMYRYGVQQTAWTATGTRTSHSGSHCSHLRYGSVRVRGTLLSGYEYEYMYEYPARPCNNTSTRIRTSTRSGI
eukprot:scaffold207667_cov26-Prasinocladus_malaysianus.AAC.1